jgi:hypothetical protein
MSLVETIRDRTYDFPGYKSRGGNFDKRILEKLASFMPTLPLINEAQREIAELNLPIGRFQVARMRLYIAFRNTFPKSSIQDVLEEITKIAPTFDNGQALSARVGFGQISYPSQGTISY